MTNADKIRSMSDEELADFLTGLLLHHRAEVIKKLQDRGIATNISVIEMPMLAKADMLRLMKAPVGEEQP